MVRLNRTRISFESHDTPEGSHHRSRGSEDAIIDACSLAGMSGRRDEAKFTWGIDTMAWWEKVEEIGGSGEWEPSV